MKTLRALWLLSALVCAACTRNDAPTPAAEYVLLAPDWRNAVVHTISLDGVYEGDFLDRARFDDPAVDRRSWEKPRGLVALAEPARFWIAAERALSEWDPRGRYQQTLFADSDRLEEPSAMRRVGDEIFVLSEDKKAMLVFDLEGVLLREFGFPHFDRAKDFVVGPDGLLYAGGSLLHTEIPGLVSVWDPLRTDRDAKPLRYHVPPNLAENGTFWVHSLAFDDDGKLLITEFSRGRVERWGLDRDEKIDVLLEDGRPGRYTELERGPDGLVYLAGSDGIRRFDSRAKAEELRSSMPFFDAETIAALYTEPFAPASLAFVPRSLLAPRLASK